MSLGYPGQGRKGTQRNRLGDVQLPSAASPATPDGHYDDDGGLRQARRKDEGLRKFECKSSTTRQLTEMLTRDRVEGLRGS